jgi:membrane protease YdiL (CAAX protease family)
VPSAFDRILALLVAELRALARERLALLSTVVGLLVVGGLGPGMSELRAAIDRPEPEEEEGEASAFDCQPGRMPPVSAVGDVPAWLAWPDPLVSAEEADIILEFGPSDVREAQEVQLVVLSPTARQTPVRACVQARIAEERRARLDALGIPERAEALVEVTVLPPGPPGGTDAEAPPPVGVSILSGMILLLSSLFLDLSPRARQSGWLETWLTLPHGRWHLLAAWWLLGTLALMGGFGLVAVGDAVACRVSGVDTGPVPWGLMLPLAVSVSALGVRGFLDVPDTRTALTKAVPILLGLGALGVGAQMVEARMPGFGGLVPFGGLGLAAIGQTEGPALAALVSILASALVMRDAARALDEIIVRAGATSRTAARRAAGDYLPEVVVLFLLGVAGVGAWVPAELVPADLAVRTTLSMLLFLGAPAALIAFPLGLDPRPLLSWRGPPLRAWLVLPILVLGTLTLGQLLWDVGLWLFPAPGMVDLYVDAIAGFQAGFGLVAVSVVPGVCEELLFRGAMLGLLRKRFPVWVAIVLQAALFAIMHSIAARFPYTFGLGLVFGVLTMRTGSLWPAMLAHTAHNLLAVIGAGELLLPLMEHPAAWVVGALAPAAAWFAGQPKKREG